MERSLAHTAIAMFEFECPDCGQRISAEEAQRGQNFECPTCACVLTVPAPKKNVTKNKIGWCSIILIFVLGAGFTVAHFSAKEKDEPLANPRTVDVEELDEEQKVLLAAQQDDRTAQLILGVTIAAKDDEKAREEGLFWLSVGLNPRRSMTPAPNLTVLEGATAVYKMLLKKMPQSIILETQRRAEKWRHQADVSHPIAGLAPMQNSLGMTLKRIFVPTGNSKNHEIWFATTETTNSQFDEYLRQKKLSKNFSGYSSGRLDAFKHVDSPATFVTRDDSMEFCGWLTEKEEKLGKLTKGSFYRIPTDHEWSCALGIGQLENASLPARKKNGKILEIYSWGIDPNVPEDAPWPYITAAQTAQFFGLKGMSDGVSEWVICENSPLSRSEIMRGRSEIRMRKPRKSLWLASARTEFDPKSEVEQIVRSSRPSSMRGRYIDVGFRCVLVVPK